MEITSAAIEAFGGMGKFVKKGQTVVLKPNVAWARPMSAAATTNPKVVKAVAKMCYDAGAERVLVVENVIDKPAEFVLKLSGVAPAAESAGAKVINASDRSMFTKISIPKGKLLSSDECVKAVIDADVFINLPIAKTHSATKVTLGLKNLMGVVWDRQAWHNSDSLHQCIADYASAVSPTLTILDANRILLTNGPKGPGKTKDVGEVIVGVDPVAVDAYGASLFNLKPEDVEHIKLAAAMGLGEMNLDKVKVERI
jgi:uncharacterized protein (DUF362 family)